MQHSESRISWVRNLLISIGAFWLSREPLVLFAWLFGHMTNRITYGDTVGSALGMGVMTGMGRAVCAGFGAAIVTLSAIGMRPQRWAWIVALLYVVAARPHYHWSRTPTGWDRLSQTADVLWPAVVCVGVAAIIARMRQGRSMTSSESGNSSLLA
jgi:hypothetical protein